MQQGGVSKATKTLNLSEDIFAGMDFVLRGAGRRIRHREYFHLAKGRDLGFNNVMLFNSKLSSGCGEQLLTRQTMRLGQLLPLPEFLTFYYAHMGYYLTQWLISWALPVLALVWLVVVLNGCELQNDFSMECDLVTRSSALLMAEALHYIFGWILALFLIAQMAPVFFETWLEAGVVAAVCVWMKQIITLSPVMFIFQSKVIGWYTINELRFGGAAYVATGRGLPTERRPFIGAVGDDGRFVPGGLYLDYARITYYDGVALAVLTGLIWLGGGMTDTGNMLVGILACHVMVIVSWLFAPFIFNPYQFRHEFFCQDLRAWCRFFFDDGGKHWADWYKTSTLKPRRGFQATVLELSFGIEFFWIVVWFTSLNAKTDIALHFSSSVDPETLYSSLWYSVILLPPLILPLLFCVGVVFVENCIQHRQAKRQARAYATLGEAALESEERQKGLAARTLGSEISAPGPRCPLMLVSVVVTIFTLAEGSLPLLWMFRLGWRKAFLIGALVKVFLLRFSLRMCMTGIRKSCYQDLEWLFRPFQLWLFAIAMIKDVVTSFIIFWSMSPLVLASAISKVACPTWSFHHLLVYRQPGHNGRSDEDDLNLGETLFDTGDSEDEEDDEDDDEDDSDGEEA